MLISPASTRGLWPVYSGRSFDIWDPDTHDYYAWVDPDYITTVLQGKRSRARASFNGFPPAWMDDPSTLPCWSPRIAFRDVTRATDSRTVRAALVPAQLVITNQAPSLLWPRGDERDQAYLLGVLCSIPLDWYARRYVEIHLNYHVFNAFPIPRFGQGHPVRRRVEEDAGRLAARDARFTSWAAAVGVPVGSVDSEDEKADIVADLDAAVSILYGLDNDDVRVMFETFHDGWDYKPRLDAVLAKRRSLR